jgi:hypothetical protein
MITENQKCGSNGRAPALQVQNPEFKVQTQVTQKKKKKKKEHIYFAIPFIRRWYLLPHVLNFGLLSVLL